MHPLIAAEIGRQRHAEMVQAAERHRRFRTIRRTARMAEPLRRPASRGFFWWLSRSARREEVRALEETPLFRGLAPRDLAFLARKADPISFNEGRVLATETEPRPELFVITCGAAEATYKGKRTAILTAGDHFGEHTVLGGEPQVATVKALSDGEGFVLGRRDFWAVLDEIPAVSQRLLSHMSQELRAAQGSSFERRTVKLEQRSTTSVA